MIVDYDGKDLIHTWNKVTWTYKLNEIRFLLFDRWIYPFETLAQIHGNYISEKRLTDDFWEWLDNHAIDGGFNY